MMSDAISTIAGSPEKGGTKARVHVVNSMSSRPSEILFAQAS